jgi:hypothetical protein
MDRNLASCVSGYISSFERGVWLSRLLGLTLSLVSLSLAMAGSSDAAVRHEFLAGPSAKISEGVPSVSGAAVTGPLSGVSAMTVDDGRLWVSEFIEGSSVGRGDSLSSTTGAWEWQREEANLESRGDGIGVGRSTGKERST